MNNRTLSGKTQRNGITITSSEAIKRSGTIYSSSGSLVVIKTAHKAVASKSIVGMRGAVSEFSRGSCLRMRRYLRECLSEYTVMVTLTYPEYFPANGKLVKEHLHRFLQELRREYKRKTNENGSDVLAGKEHSSFWFLEFQERGAPHFHIFTTQCESKDWVASTWARIVASDDKYHKTCGTRIEFIRSGRAGMVSYVAKYAAKSEQKTVPLNYENVGRFWGVYGQHTVVSAATFVGSDAKAKNDAKNSVKALQNTLELMISKGDAEVIRREYGACVITVFEKCNQKMIRAKIARIACSVGMLDTMFNCADIEYGDGYAIEML